MSEEISYEIDAARGLLRVRIPGSATPQQLADAMNALRADPRHEPLRPALFDLRGAAAMPPLERMHQLAEVGKMSPIDLATPRALVVNAGAAFEAAHHFSLLAQRQGRYFGVFTEPDAAVKWLLARRPTPG